VLASSSPRRIELLRLVGLPFDVVDPGEDEVALGSPEERVRKNAFSKANVVASRVSDCLVVAADTLVVLDDQVLGKPKSASEARSMLRLLSGRVHSVITCITIIDSRSGRAESEIVKTKVLFKTLSEDEIDSYVQTNEPLDKAGGYAIQGLGALLVEEIHGCFYNVVGLPLAKLSSMLKRFGVDVIGGSKASVVGNQ